MSNEDRGWMYRRRGNDGFGISNEFEEGLKSFIEFAIRQPRYMDGDKIRCPCKKECRNRKYVYPTIAYHHIRENGFIDNYSKWISHGEVDDRHVSEAHIIDRAVRSARDGLMDPGFHTDLDEHDSMDVDEHFTDGMMNMVRDAVGPNFESSREEQPNPEAKKFYDTLSAANQELYYGCDKSLLLAVAQLLNIKAETNMSENAYNRMMSTFKSLLPKENSLPENFYCTKKLVSSLGLGLQKIDACKNDCMLFYTQENIKLTKCVVCGEDRYKPKRRGSSKHKKNIPQKDDTAEVKLTRDNVKLFLLDIFTAGMETTSKTIMWTLAEIINNPGVCRKLRDEIKTVVGVRRLVEESDVPNLPYLQAVLKETLRLHATLPLIVRKCRVDCQIGGYDIPAGSRVLVNVFAIMRDEDSWENPLEYIPERFLGSQVDMKGQDFNFLPFGSGRRRCPGLGLAHTVMHVTVATLVQCFDWKTEGNKKVEMKEGSGFTMGMACPLICFPTLIVCPTEINL